MNIFQHLDRYSGTAIVDQNRNVVHYPELLSDADKLAGYIPPRSLVLVICSNTLECIVGYVGFIRRNIVVLLLSNKANPKDIDELIERYSIEYIYCPTYIKQTSLTKYVNGYKSYFLLRSCNASPKMYPELSLLLATSGSTGKGKIVRLSSDNLCANTLSIVKYLGIKSTDRAITTLPMSYTYGLSIINTHLYTGASIALSSLTVFHQEFWDFFVNTEVTTFGGVPYTYQLLEKCGFTKHNYPSLRYMTQAGGKLSQKTFETVVDYCETYNKKFIVMYGQTEATARISYLPWSLAKQKKYSIGKAIPGGNMELIDEDGVKILNSDEVGEIVYSGKNVMLGYASNSDDLALGDCMDGQLFTGDLAIRDSNGNYYIVGRKSRFVKLFGERISLILLEEALQEIGVIAACKGNDEFINVYYKGELTDKEELIYKKLCDQFNIKRWQIKLENIQEFPLSESGKILYSEL